MSPIVLAEFRQSEVIDTEDGVAAPGRNGAPSLLGGAPSPVPAEAPMDVRLVIEPSWPDRGRLMLGDRRRRLVPVRYPDACLSTTSVQRWVIRQMT